MAAVHPFTILITSTEALIVVSVRVKMEKLGYLHQATSNCRLNKNQEYFTRYERYSMI